MTILKARLRRRSTSASLSGGCQSSTAPAKKHSKTIREQRAFEMSLASRTISCRRYWKGWHKEVSSRRRGSSLFGEGIAQSLAGHLVRTYADETTHE